MNNYIVIGLVVGGGLLLFSDSILAGVKSVGGLFKKGDDHSHDTLEDMVACYLSDPDNELNAEQVRGVIKEVSSYCYLKELEEQGVVK